MQQYKLGGVPNSEGGDHGTEGLSPRPKENGQLNSGNTDANGEHQTIKVNFNIDLIKWATE